MKGGVNTSTSNTWGGAKKSQKPTKKKYKVGHFLKQRIWSETSVQVADDGNDLPPRLQNKNFFCKNRNTLLSPPPWLMIGW